MSSIFKVHQTTWKCIHRYTLGIEATKTGGVVVLELALEKGNTCSFHPSTPLAFSRGLAAGNWPAAIKSGNCKRNWTRKQRAGSEASRFAGRYETDVPRFLTGRNRFRGVNALLSHPRRYIFRVRARWELIGKNEAMIDEYVIVGGRADTGDENASKFRGGSREFLNGRDIEVLGWWKITNGPISCPGRRAICPLVASGFAQRQLLMIYARRMISF